MNEGDFWNNLDGFVGKQSGEKNMEKVDDWLKNIPDPDGKDLPKAKTKSPTG